jgi:uncharacterized protein (TIGR02231 family)
MKKSILGFLLFITGFYCFALPENRVGSKINKVIVYRQNAKIYCNATAKIPAGSSEIIIDRQSTFVDANSVQVSLNNNVTLLSVTFRINYLKEQDKSKELGLLQDSVDLLENDLAGLRNSRQVYEGEKDLLKQNTKLGSNDKGFTVIELQNLANFYRSRMMELENQILVIKNKEKKLSDKITRIRKQIDEINNLQTISTGEIVLEVSSVLPVTTEFNFSYLVANVSWEPLYELRSDGIGKPFEITYKANILQNSGVKWENVDITLSTGNPVQNNTRPVLNPLFVKYYIPPVYNYESRNGREMSRNLAVAPSMAKDDAGALSNEQLNPYQGVNETQLAVEFETNLKYNIPSDGKPHLVELKKLTYPAVYEYHTVPKLDKGAFLLAKVAEWGKLNLIPGNANLFFEGSYVGQSFIDPASIADTLLISLGRDEKIIVKREKLIDLTASKLIGNSKKETLAFEITIRNTKNSPVKIEILDQVPLATNSEIEVEIIESGGAIYEKDYGKLLWNIEIKPNETKKLKLVYSVKYPKDKHVIGIE